MTAPGRPKGAPVRACWTLLAAIGLLATPWAALAGSTSLRNLQSQVDALVQSGHERPDPALQALGSLEQGQAALPPAAAGRQVLWLARALTLASVGREAQALAAIAAVAPGARNPLFAADAALVTATLADGRGDAAKAVQAAQEALHLYGVECPAQPGCDYRSSWRALKLQARHAGRRGQHGSARELALAGAELARAAADNLRQAWSLAMAADFAAAAGAEGDEHGHLAQAQRLAALDGAPNLAARIKIYEARIRHRRGDAEGARIAIEEGIALAQLADTPRLEAVLVTKLSDIQVKTGNPQAALQTVARALPVVRQFGDRRGERALLHNDALARIGLGQAAAVKPLIDRLLANYRESGATGDEAEALHEFADAFAAAGDLKSALALYHRERRQRAELMDATRNATLADLRGRFDREAELHRLEQLTGYNALMTAQLANKAAMHKVWAGGAGVLGLAMLLLALLYRRVRRINNRLARNHAFLREQSHRDALTGLANRRCLHETAAAKGLDQHFAGALLLVDIDHFKAINDGHGHGVGDAVLVELARRLAEAVRDADLVVRWGGEEFLIYMPGVAGAQAQVLAERALAAVGASPVPLLGGRPLRVTASAGYGVFPLLPGRLSMSLERAINLADMALYTAKHQGRNRAIGIAALNAADHEALRSIEAGFDQACQDGRVSLHRSQGPAAPPQRDAEPLAQAAV